MRLKTEYKRKQKGGSGLASMQEIIGCQATTER